MTRLDSAEVPLIECDHEIRPKALSERNDRRIGATKREVGVLTHQLSHAPEVLNGWRDDFEFRETFNKPGLHHRAVLALDQVGCLSHTQRRDNERHRRVAQDAGHGIERRVFRISYADQRPTIKNAQHGSVVRARFEVFGPIFGKYGIEILPVRLRPVAHNADDGVVMLL